MKQEAVTARQNGSSLHISLNWLHLFVTIGPIKIAKVGVNYQNKLNISLTFSII